MDLIRATVQKRVEHYYDVRECRTDLSKEERDEIKRTTDFTNKEEVLKAVKCDGSLLRYASERLKADVEVVCAASMINPSNALYANQRFLKSNLDMIVWNNPRAIELLPILLDKPYLEPSTDEVLDYLRRDSYSYKDLLRNIDLNDYIVKMAAVSAAYEKFLARYIKELEGEGLSLKTEIPEEICQNIGNAFKEISTLTVEIGREKEKQN